MSKFQSTPSDESEGLPYIEINELLTEVKQSQGHYYQMINLEVWALIETLDQFFPGSWNRFMSNRQLSMKQFLQRQRSQKQSKPPTQTSDYSPLNKDEFESGSNETPDPKPD